jgi:hypothetical protein
MDLFFLHEYIWLFMYPYKLLQLFLFLLWLLSENLTSTTKKRTEGIHDNKIKGDLQSGLSPAD